jgi:ankyrin repeat protein
MSKTRLIEAVKHLDIEETRQILDANPALLQVITPNGRNLLHVACTASSAALEVPESRAVKMVGMLLDRGLNIDELGLSGRDPCPPLFFAVAFGRNPAVVKYLLDRGADIRAVPGGGLFAAGWWDDTAHLKLLLDAGAPIDVVVGVTPFLASWCWKRFEAAKYLAKRGADVNYQDPKGRTALHHGIEKEFDPALLTWLVKHGASPDIEDHTGVTPRVKASRKRDKRWAAALGARAGRRV